MMIERELWPAYTDCMVNYATRYVRDGLIDQDGREYRVHPLPGKGKTVHRVTRRGCSCQGFAVRGRCSHYLAVHYYRRTEVAA